MEVQREAMQPPWLEAMRNEDARPEIITAQLTSAGGCKGGKSQGGFLRAKPGLW